ncbi:MAG TPA: pantoate--beta-alanine ligase [Myxococcaceae bacterium]|nr:pantoate--beta-alanine ligase [Myxococcaceae bacterium]
MRVLRTPAELAEWTETARRQGRRVGLVPTMGFLHRGHLSLIDASRERADTTVVSIFVNPAQFGPTEDLARYPRDLEGDLHKCREAKVDAVFAPEAGAMYPPGHRTFVEVTQLQDGLCGARRPGHFRGVATVVTQLFALARPHLAVFGEKDWQQLQIIRRLALDLHLGVEVVGMPIVREADGLAMSSRNAYLSPPERARAVALSGGLRAARARWSAGERGAAALRGAVRAELRAAEVREDYVELVDPGTLEPLERADRPDARLLVAGFLGATRLIDNTAVG